MAKKRKGSHVTAKTGFYTYHRRGKYLTGSFRHSTCSADHSQKVRYFIKRLSNNYFRLRKANNCHIEILLPVSILTCHSSSASHFALARQISCEFDHRRRNYDVIKIFKMAAVDIVNQLLVSV